MREREILLQDILQEDCVAAVLYDICGQRAERAGYLTVAATLKQMGLYKREHVRLWMQELGMVLTTPEELEKLLSYGGRERYERYATQVQEQTLATQLGQVAQCEGEMETMLLKQLAQLQLQQIATEQGTHGRCCRCGFPWHESHMPQVCPVCGSKHSFVEK